MCCLCQIKSCLCLVHSLSKCSYIMKNVLEKQAGYIHKRLVGSQQEHVQS